MARLVDRNMRTDLLQQARLTAQSIDVERIRALSGTAADPEQPDYRRLKQQLLQLRQVYSDSRFLYLMGRQADGRIFFFADSEPIGSPDESPAGQLYPEASTALQQAFITGKSVVEGPVADRWGVWVSALVPLRDPRSGEVIALFGIDVEAADWRSTIGYTLLIPIGFMVGLLLVLGIGCLLLDRRRRLPFPDQHTGLRRHLEALVTACCGLLLTLLLAQQFGHLERHARQHTFNHIAMENSFRIVDALKGIRDYQLTGLARFLGIDPRIDWRRFVGYSAHLSRNTAVQGWAWAPAVTAAQLADIETAMRRAGFEHFHVWQQDAEGNRMTAHGREVHYPVLYMNTMRGEFPVQGYDLGSEPTRHATLVEAARTGLTSATDPIDLIGTAEPGIVIIEPVYGAEDLRGFALAAVRTRVLLEHAMRDTADTPTTPHLSLYQLHDHAPHKLLATTHAELNEAALSTPRLHADSAGIVPMAVPFLGFGKSYALIVEPNVGFASFYPTRAYPLTLLAGIVLTAVLSLFVDHVSNRRHRLESSVQARTRELQASHERLHKLATTDPLTELPNRRSFMERLQQEFARLQRFPDLNIAVLMLDLDHFKRINDRHGHATGDDVLKHFAALLRSRLRQTDMAGRLGGEEFALLLPTRRPDDARRFAEQLRQTLHRTPFHHADGPLAFTVSIGISRLAPTDHNAEVALSRADTALYRAKQKGRDRVETEDIAAHDDAIIRMADRNSTPTVKT